MTNFPARFDLRTLDGHNGFAILGRNERDYSGWSVSGAGDVNGDGVADLIIGTDQVSPGGRFAAGASYVVFGHKDGFTAELDLGTLDGDNGFAILGGNGGVSGWSVSAAKPTGSGSRQLRRRAPAASARCSFWPAMSSQ